MEVRDAWKAAEGEERAAVREAQGQGNVEGARGEDRELARSLEPRRKSVAFCVEQIVVVAGRDDCAEEGGGPQRRQGGGAQERLASSGAAPSPSPARPRRPAGVMPRR